MSFSLYIHIPYCHSKCPYCDFNSYAASSWPENEYVQAVAAEMRHRADEAPWCGSEVKTIFFGGGTPSLFDSQSIATLIDEAERLFGIEPGAEITLEANPGTVSASKLSGFRSAGVNRLSFGAQSFNEDTLKFLGRIHSADETRTAVRLSRHVGFERINLDLIFAVPGQTLEQVGYDIAEAAALEPDHISAYNLTFEEGTAFFTEMKRGRIRPLENDDQAEMYYFVRNELPQRGYPMYEISNYAEPGHEARHNLSYWRAESYLGLGAGAHGCEVSRQMRRRWWNERLPVTYMRRAGASGVAEAGSETIDERTAASEFVFLGLRLREGISLVEFEHRFGRSFDSIFSDPASRMMAAGLVERDGTRLRLTDRGLELADSVFAEFL